MQRTPIEPMVFFVSGKAGSSSEDPVECENQPDEASREIGIAGSRHVSSSEGSEASTEDEGSEAADIVHEDKDADDDAASTAVSASSSGRSSRASDDIASTSSSCTVEVGRAMANLSCRLCSEEGSALEEPLFRCPCRCSDAFVHRSCLEQLLYLGPDGRVCTTCGVHYPVRHHTKPLWQWFWEKESREDATLFLANLVFSMGNIGVLTMAWLYVLFEYRSKSWLPTASLSSALFVLSVLWVTFGCLRFHVLFMSLVQWRRDNTTLKVLLTNKTVAQA